MAGANIKRVEQADIRHEGTAILLPQGMPIQAAIDSLERRKAYENETTSFTETVECFPWDGAVALNRVLMRRYGWAQAEPTPGFFGKEPPKMLGIDVGPNEVMQVPWGRFSLPNVKGWIQTGSTQRDGRVIFQIQAEVLRKHEEDVKTIAADVRLEVQRRSIYRGKSLKMRFEDEHGERIPLPWPKFLDVSNVKADDLIYSDEVQNAILTNLITPLDRYENLPDYGIPFKRGVLLAGVFGTGKTLAAFYAANRANAKGITFVYVERAAEFQQAVTFARQYLPALVFCEDIDRVTGGERDEQIDSIMNTIDGIDSKTADLMVVLTTNDVKAINQGMLRPGRLDAIIEVKPPDAKAVIRLIRLYGRGLIDPKCDYARVGERLAGQIPAVVREVVERAKLAAMRLQSISAQSGGLVITDEALMDSTYTMTQQIDLLNRSDKPGPTEMQQFGSAMGNAVGDALRELTEAWAKGHEVGVYEMTDGENHVLPNVPAGAMAALAGAHDDHNHDDHADQPRKKTRN